MGLPRFDSWLPLTQMRSAEQEVGALLAMSPVSSPAGGSVGVAASPRIRAAYPEAQTEAAGPDSGMAETGVNISATPTKPPADSHAMQSPPPAANTPGIRYRAIIVVHEIWPWRCVLGTPLAPTSRKRANLKTILFHAPYCSLKTVQPVDETADVVEIQALEDLAPLLLRSPAPAATLPAPSRLASPAVSRLPKTPSRLPKPPPRTGTAATEGSRLARPASRASAGPASRASAAPANRPQPAGPPARSNIVTGWKSTPAETQQARQGPHQAAVKPGRGPSTVRARAPSTAAHRATTASAPRSGTPSPQKRPPVASEELLTPHTAHLRYLEEHPELAFAAGSTRMMNSPQTKEEPVRRVRACHCLVCCDTFYIAHYICYTPEMPTFTIIFAGTAPDGGRAPPS